MPSHHTAVLEKLEPRKASHTQFASPSQPCQLETLRKHRSPVIPHFTKYLYRETGSVAAADVSEQAGGNLGWLCVAKVLPPQPSSGRRLWLLPPCRARPTSESTADSALFPALTSRRWCAGCSGRSKLRRPEAEHHLLPRERSLCPEAQCQDPFSLCSVGIHKVACLNTRSPASQG